MGHSLESHIMFSILEIFYSYLRGLFCLPFALSSIGKNCIIEFCLKFVFFSEGPCEYVMNDHVLLNISTVTGKCFRIFLFNFNLTGV